MTALSDIHGPEPARGRPPLLLGDARGRLLDQRALGRLVELTLALGIRAAVADDLVAALAEGCDKLRRMVVERGVDEHRCGPALRVEKLEKPPGADAVAVFAPSVVQHIGVRGGRKLRAEALTEGEVLEVQPEIDGEPLAVRPFVGRDGRRSGDSRSGRGW